MCDRDGDVVVDAEPAPGCGERVVRAAAEVRPDAVLEGGVGGEQRRSDGTPGALDELRRPGKPEGQLLAAGQFAALHASEVVGLVREPQLLRGRRPGVGDVDLRPGLRPLAHQPVLAEGEAVSGRQRVREYVVGERAHRRRA